MIARLRVTRRIVVLAVVWLVLAAVTTVWLLRSVGWAGVPPVIIAWFGGVVWLALTQRILDDRAPLRVPTLGEVRL